MYRRRLLAACAGTALAALSAPAYATFFSFASDVNSNAFTFGGTAGAGGSFTLTDFSRPNTYTLLIDDDNGPLATRSLTVEFRANLTLTNGTSTSITPTLFQHTYRVTGNFGFFDAMGNALLTVDVGPTNPAIFTVPGSQNAWATSGAVLGADSFATVTYTATTALINALGGAAQALQYGIAVGPGGTGTSPGPDDFAFDLTAINAGALGAAVALDPTTRLPTSSFRSESSFSGSTFNGIPSPGAMGLLVIGCGMLARPFSRRK